MSIPEEQKLKLESMQRKGILWMIWDNISKETVESRLLQIKNQGTTNDICKLLSSQNRATLIKLIEQSPEITPDTIDATYEKYRYGLKPGFTLFWAKQNNAITIKDTVLHEMLSDYLSSIHYEDDAKYKGLECGSIVNFNDILEVPVTYLQRFNYINENGEFTFVYMMKEGFIWVGINRNFIAINNLPDILMNSIKLFFSKTYSAGITNIKITNSLLKKVFSSKNTKKITRHNSNPPENQLEKITVSDPKLSEKSDCLPSGYDDYAITNTQYIEEIDNDTVGTLGINCDKGKLTLSKNLTSTQFREWSIRRIDGIINYFQNSADISLESICGRNMFSLSTWSDIKGSSIPFLNEIVFAIINCKKTGTTVYPISFDTYKAYVDLNDFFTERVAFVCDDCQEKAVPFCDVCGKSSFSITKRSPIKIICQNCGKFQETTFSFSCENGHVTEFNDINQVIELISNDEFTSRLYDTIKLYYPEIHLEKNEYFVLSPNSLEMHCSPNYAKLKPSDISDFAPVCEHKLVRSYPNLISIYNGLKEKCSNSCNDNCTKCKYKNIKSEKDIGCFLKLFEHFDNFTAQPHQGHEFGDVSMLVSIDGRNYTFLGAAKSGTTKITKSTKLGRELIEQLLSAMQDTRAEVIGLIYPGIISEQLKSFLYNEAKLHNTQLVILDQEFMLKLLDIYLEDNGI